MPPFPSTPYIFFIRSDETSPTVNWNGNNYTADIGGVPQFSGIYTDISRIGLNNAFITTVPFVFTLDMFNNDDAGVNFNSFSASYAYVSGDNVGPDSSLIPPINNTTVPFGEYFLVSSNIEDDSPSPEVKQGSLFGTINDSNTGIIETNVNLGSQNSKYAVIYQSIRILKKIFTISCHSRMISQPCVYTRTH